MNMKKGQNVSKPARRAEMEETALLTKTRLRRGEIAREKPELIRCAEIIDFVPPVHGDVEDILFDVAGENPDDKEPPD